MTPRTPLLSVQDLRIEFKTHDGVVKAVNDVSFDIDRGETLGVVGESGCGKSVTALALLRLIHQPPGRIVGGRILLDGVDLLQLSDDEMRKVRGKRIAMIFQDPMTSLNPVLTIAAQFVELLVPHMGMTPAAARDRAIELLGMVGVQSPQTRVDDYPHQFSGGMRQRVMIAMALSCEPDLLIADEPTTALDVTIQAQIIALIRKLTAEMGTAVLFISHDLGVVAQLCDRINVMYAGHVIETATTAELFARPRHPYTLGLLDSIPRLDGPPDTPLTPIPGSPPDLVHPPKGCPFAPRCGFKTERSEAERPRLREAAPGHLIACHVDLATRPAALAPAAAAPPAGTPAPLQPLLLEVRNLEVHIPVMKGTVIPRRSGEVRAVDGVSFTLHRGETLGLVGESGCGKSTTGRAILQLQAPTGGEVVFEGENLRDVRGEKLRRMRRRMQMIFQDPYSSLNPRMTVRDIVGEPLDIHGEAKGAAREARIQELLQLCGLKPAFADRYPHEFSGGQRQRVGIARALALNPSLIIADEPVSALDVSVQAQIVNLLEDLQDRLGLTYLFIAHDLAVVRHISDRVAVMFRGRIVELADRDDLYERPLHPYTRALLEAAPTPDPDVTRRDDRHGGMPLMLRAPIATGCPYRIRCPLAIEVCANENPPLRDVGGRLAACHRI